MLKLTHIVQVGITNIVDKKAEDTIINKFSYKYDGDGNVLNMPTDYG